MKKRPNVVIPSGDPSGIGIEIVLKALSHGLFESKCAIIVVADLDIVELTATQCKLSNPFQVVVEEIAPLIKELKEGKHTILFHQKALDLTQFQFGVIDAQCGKAAYEALKTSVDLVNASIADVIVTPPLHKESLQLAQVNHIGNTEILSSLTKSEKAITMFQTLNLKIFFMSRHLSLLNAIKGLTKSKLYNSIKECYEISRHPSFDQSLPLAVAALNPHASDGGLFGNEERDVIIPTIEQIQQEGLYVVGPIGADSVFHLAKEGKYRAVLSLYHDQGHIAAKTLDFNRTVSVTWGLPMLRSSVDHGTAFDIAGKGIANEESMSEAITVALKYFGTQSE